jgi:FKBP-type peptidyl-prolyl cis-trans isomerase
VIKGFDDGMIGMKVGGRRRLTIPPNLGYGSQGSGPVPGNATIIFDVTLNSIVGK